MRTHTIAAMLLTTLTVLPVARAQEASPTAALAAQFVDPEHGLSVDDAIRAAVAREPGLRSVRTEVDVAKGRRLQASLRPNPSVSIERREEPSGSDNQTMGQVQWPLDLFRRAPRVAVAERAIEVSERTVDDRVRLLTADVRARFGDAAAAVRDLTLADEAVTLTSRQFELVRQRVAEGAVPPLERDQAEVELHRYEAERILALGRAEAAMIALKQAVGLPIATPLRLSQTIEALAPIALDKPISANVQITGEGSPPRRTDVRLADAQETLAGARVIRAQSEGRFDVSLFGGYTRMDAGFPQLGFGHSGGLEPIGGVFHYVSIGAMLTVPLRNQNQGEVAALRAEQAGAGARAEGAQLAAQAEVAAAQARDTAARHALSIMASNVRLAARNLDVVRQAYALGRTTQTDVLTEQRRYLDVERAHTDTMKAAYDAHVALLLAQGER